MNTLELKKQRREWKQPKRRLKKQRPTHLRTKESHKSTKLGAIVCMKGFGAKSCVFRHASFFTLMKSRLSPAVIIAWELESIQKVIAYAYILKCFPSTVWKFLYLHNGLCFI